MLLTSFYKEGTSEGTRADIHESSKGYFIRYYSNGALLKEETFEGKSIHFVQSAAENWISGVKTLNG